MKSPVLPSNCAYDYSELPDRRLAKPANKLFNAVLSKRSNCIRQLGATRAERASFYRLLHNDRLDVQMLSDSHNKAMIKDLWAKELLVIQDTTEANFEHLRHWLKPQSGLGVISDDKSLGFLAHPSLIVDAQGGGVIGLGHSHNWIRPEGRVPFQGKGRKSLAIEEKESYRWIACAQLNQSLIQSARSITYVQDREADQYEGYVRMNQLGVNFIVRSATSRRLGNSEQLLKPYMQAQPCQATYRLQIKDNPKRKSRTAKINLKYSAVNIRCPDRLKKWGYRESIDLYAVQAQEQSGGPLLEKEKPINWLLLTSHPVTCVAQAKQVLGWYKKRWLIEELFRISKKKGFNLQGIRLRSGDAIIKFSTILMQASVRILQLKQARKGNTDQKTKEVFDPQQIECLDQLNGRLEGRTEKLRNPFPKHNLAWASWIIGRLGGWSGYQSERPPGVITLTNGMQRFEGIYEGWSIANDDGK